MRPRVFISYTHRSERDVTIAFRLARHLRDFGCEVWIDSQLQVGRRFPDQIYSTIINESDYFIVLLSPDSIKRDWVKREMTVARASWGARQRPLLLPALIAPCRIPDILGRELHCANFQGNYVEGLSEIIREILRGLYGDSSFRGEITKRLCECQDDDEISQVLRENQIEPGSLRVVEPEIFINRREEIRLFLNILKPDSFHRVLIFHHAGNEPRLGSSYLLRFLAQANLDNLAFLAGERKHLDRSWFSGFHRLLFRSGGGYAGSISYPTDMMVRTVNVVGEHLFPGYLRECRAYGNQSIGNRYNPGWNWFTLPSYDLPPFVPVLSTLDFLEDINRPRILEKITRAFLEDMRRNFARVVWLIDGPWGDLPIPVVEWLGSILARVGRGEIQNLWLVFGGQEPLT